MIKTVVTNNKTYDVKESEYEYDKVGNKVKESINDEVTTNTYNKLNQIVSSKTANDEGIVSNRQFTYDNNGNQIKAVDDVKGTDLTYTYDADNRISKVSGTSEKKAVSQENLYNGDGKRIKKIEEDSEINYFYQNDSVLATSDKEDKLISFNIYGDGANVISTMRNTVSGGREYYTYNKDVRGSTSSIVDSQGTAQAIYYYDDFGNITAKGNFQNEICYTGGIYDETTGLYYLNARYYNPEDGNFMSQDIYRGEYTNPATLNYYGYCGGNPINYIDPRGHKSIKVLCYGEKRAKHFIKQGQNSGEYNRKNADIYYFSSDKDFIRKWNNLRGYMSKIYIYVHGGKGELYFYGKTLTVKGIRNKLKKKKVSTGVALYSCSGGAGKVGSNVAWAIAEKVPGKKVLASEGSVSFRKEAGKYYARTSWHTKYLFAKWKNFMYCKKNGKWRHISSNARYGSSLSKRIAI